MYRIIPFLVGVCVALTPLTALAQGGSPGVPSGGAPGASGSLEEVLIGFEAFPGAAEENLVRALGGEVNQTFWLVPAIAASIPGDAREALERNPHVRYVEDDAEVFALGQTVPWGVDRVFGEEAYSFQTWTTSRGTGIGVAVLDTGIDAGHEDLTVTGGTTTVDDTDWRADVNGHGTHVAGTIAALDNELGVVGVAPDVRLYAVKVLDDTGSGSISSVVAGIQWAADHEDIRVANMSLGTSSNVQTLREACDQAYAEGLLLVASAGNSGNPGGRGNNVGYPARYDSVIAVAASTQNDTRASFSSTGPDVELIAPGVAVLSTLPGDQYGTANGTSMASPHVAGVAALAWAADPGLWNDELRLILQDTAEDLGLDPNHQGYGLARADRAVDAAANAEGGDPAPASVSVATLDATNIDTTSAKLNGELTELTGAEDAEVWFEWRASGATGWNTTDEMTLSGTGGFSYELSGLDSGTEYEFRAAARADGDASDTGNNRTFATGSEDEETPEEPTGLSVDELDLSDNSNPRWTRVSVAWAVSGNNLSEVTSELRKKGDTAVIDSAASSVSGSTAAGDHDLRERDGGGAYEVTVTVIDIDGNSEARTEEIGGL